MKRVFLTCLSGLAGAGFASAEASDATVRFSNDDRLRGSMESLSADVLVWKSPLLEKPCSFFLKNVMELNLAGTLKDTNSDHEAVLTLTNGDIARGQLSSVTDEFVSLDTPYAGRMNFNRLNVKSLEIQTRQAALYRGPSGMDGWVTTGQKTAWSFAKSSFISGAAGGIGKEDLLPEECSINFDAAWKGDSFGFKVVVFSRNVSKNDDPSGYEFSFQRGGFFVRNCKTGAFLGQAQAQEFVENEKVRMEIRASSKTGKLCLFVNDRITEIWDDPDFKKGAFGAGLQFASVSSNPVRISSIVVSGWDGVVEQIPDPQIGRFRGIRWGAPIARPTPKEKPKESRMELANGDSIEGDPTSIKDGIIAIKTPLGDVKLPVARLRNINLKKQDLETCRLNKGDVRAWFPDGTSLVFRFDSVADGFLSGFSQNFGKAAFKINEFSRIEFNIHDPELEGKRGATDW